MPRRHRYFIAVSHYVKRWREWKSVPLQSIHWVPNCAPSLSGLRHKMLLVTTIDSLMRRRRAAEGYWERDRNDLHKHWNSFRAWRNHIGATRRVGWNRHKSQRWQKSYEIENHIVSRPRSAVYLDRQSRSIANIFEDMDYRFVSSWYYMQPNKQQSQGLYVEGRRQNEVGSNQKSLLLQYKRTIYRAVTVQIWSFGCLYVSDFMSGIVIKYFIRRLAPSTKQSVHVWIRTKGPSSSVLLGPHFTSIKRPKWHLE